MEILLVVYGIGWFCYWIMLMMRDAQFDERYQEGPGILLLVGSIWPLALPIFLITSLARKCIYK